MEMYMLDGKKLVRTDSLEEWGECMENRRHIGNDFVGDVRISTIFLGLDIVSNLLGTPPALFETMIFSNDDNNLYRVRYHTYEEAEEGHKRILEDIKNGVILG